MSNKNFEPHLWKLEDLFAPIYNVPVYQRPYLWEKEQVSTLLNDIYDVYYSNEKNDGYYLGNIIIYENGNKINGLISQYDLIDGQQRITTFSLILLAIHALLIEYRFEDEDEMRDLKDLLWKKIDRKNTKEYCTLRLNGLGQDCLKFLFDRSFDDSKNINKLCKTYKRDSKFEEIIIDNFLYILNSLKENVVKDKSNNILYFTDYIFKYLEFIVIIANCKERKVFSMFESVNSKGKRLEEIDLIKSYIFSKLDKVDYDKYSNIWGSLTKETKDNLYDYLYIYVKAYVYFYRQSIKIYNFKKLCEYDFQRYFNVNSEVEAIKCLLDDMYSKVEYYNMLTDKNLAGNLLNNNQLKFYYRTYLSYDYQHPKPLFFRALFELNNGTLDKSEFKEVIIETTAFLIKFLGIARRSSKEVITTFSNIMNDVYKERKISIKHVKKEITRTYINEGIESEGLKQSLYKMDGYEQNKKLTIFLLSMYEAMDDQGHVSYDNAYNLTNSYGESFSLGHMLVQRPDKESEDFRYYENSEGNLTLKENSDFPDTAYSGMDYSTFISQHLNKIGNLRLYYKDENSKRKNKLLKLKDYGKFNTYEHIKQREKDLIDRLIDNVLPYTETTLDQYQQDEVEDERENKFIKMDKLIEFGYVKIGDKLLITTDPSKSEATLLDEKHVDYKGRKLTLNEWGKEVTGWKSIRIYSYVSKVGETETLQDKREKYNNENKQI